MAEHSTLYGAIKITHVGKLKQIDTKTRTKMFLKSKWIRRIYKFRVSESNTRLLKFAL